MSNALLTLLRGSSSDRATSRAAYCEAFSEDLFELVKANNKDSIIRALQAIGKGAKWQDLSGAITAGLATCVSSLPAAADGTRPGWIAAAHGGIGYAKATPEQKGAYALAHIAGLEAFTSALSGCDTWRDITDTDKANAKALREGKKAEAEALQAEEKAKAVQAEVSARVASGELVERDRVRLLSDYTVVALISEIGDRADITAHDLQDLKDLCARIAKHQGHKKAA